MLKRFWQSLAALYLGLCLAMFSGTAAAVSLIPAGTLDTAFQDITDTGQAAFTGALPVIVKVTALILAIALVKRFISRAA